MANLKKKPEAMTDDELRAEILYLESTLDTVHVDPAAGRAQSMRTWEMINDLEELLTRRQDDAGRDLPFARG